jgi:hypothetical protein
LHPVDQELNLRFAQKVQAGSYAAQIFVISPVDRSVSLRSAKSKASALHRAGSITKTGFGHVRSLSGCNKKHKTGVSGASASVVNM